jgi:hypothetical protein
MIAIAAILKCIINSRTKLYGFVKKEMATWELAA